MIKRVTSATVFQDAVGMRLSMTQSEMDETTGRIESDNKRVNRVLIDSEIINHANAILSYAQTFIDNQGD